MKPVPVYKCFELRLGYDTHDNGLSVKEVICVA